MIFLYKLRPGELVGTDIAHAFSHYNQSLELQILIQKINPYLKE